MSVTELKSKLSEKLKYSKVLLQISFTKSVCYSQTGKKYTYYFNSFEISIQF